MMRFRELLLEIKSLDIYSPAEWEEYIESFCHNEELKQHLSEQPHHASKLLGRIKERRGADSVEPDYGLSPKLVRLEALGGLESRSEVTLGIMSGCFDLLHLGHVRGLICAKRFLANYPNPKLCAMTLSDEHIGAKKGSSRPVLNLNERLDLLCHAQCVDYVLPLKNPNCLAALAQLRPNYYFKNAADKSQRIVVREMELVKVCGGQVIFFSPDAHTVKPTTAIIETVLTR